MSYTLGQTAPESLLRQQAGAMLPNVAGLLMKIGLGWLALQFALGIAKRF